MRLTKPLVTAASIALAIASHSLATSKAVGGVTYQRIDQLCKGSWGEKGCEKTYCYTCPGIGCSDCEPQYCNIANCGSS